MRDLANVKEAIAKERRSLPTCNREKFDAEAASYLDEMEFADDATFQLLAAKLWQRTQMMKAHDLSAAPPLLCKKINETSDAYIERCYQAGGYYAGR